LGSSSSEEFFFKLVVTDTSGKQITAKALSGDIGNMVKGGSDKRITWDFGTERVEMNADIYVKVQGQSLN